MLVICSVRQQYNVKYVFGFTKNSTHSYLNIYSNLAAEQALSIFMVWRNLDFDNFQDSEDVGEDLYFIG